MVEEKTIIIEHALDRIRKRGTSLSEAKKTSGFPFRRCISALNCSARPPHSGNI